jgi:UPF0042 nucleotide-binding protein
MDIRERKLVTHFSETLASLRQHYTIEVIFLEASEDALIRRFKETRRPHPLGLKDLRKAVLREVKLMQEIRNDADTIIDTSALTPHKLRKFITDHYMRQGSQKMVVNLISFGYKYGVPPEADLLFDVRFLPNPYFIESLKAFPGTSARVSKFVLSQESTTQFLEKLYPLLDHVLPLYAQEGRKYLTIGIGCTGGRHRSPCLVQEIEGHLKKKKLNTTITHRDLEHESQ